MQPANIQRHFTRTVSPAGDSAIFNVIKDLTAYADRTVVQRRQMSFNYVCVITI